MNLNELIIDASKEANDIISKLDSSPFSEKAYTRLEDKFNEYISSLIVESIKISKRQKADLVSQSHIEQANDYLISKRKSKWSYLFGTLGGVFLGTAVSNTFGMLVFNTTFTVVGIAATIIIGMIGVFLVTMNLNNN